MKNKNDVITLKITDMNNLGCGVGRDTDGCVTFVNGAVTGDTVRATVIKVNKNYCVARLAEVLEPSPFRSKRDFCSAPASCGGCVYRNVTREYELESKRSYVEGLFRKAGFADVEVGNVLTTGKRERYRNKAQYPVRSTKNGMRAGFFGAKTHTIIGSECCMLEPEIFSDIVHTVCAFADENGISAYDELTGKGILRHIYLRRGEVTGELMVCLVINADSFPMVEKLVKILVAEHPDIAGVLLNINKKNTNVVTGSEYITVYGKPYIEDILCGLKFRISPEAFWQVNHDCAELLYKTAAERAELDGTDELLDLYCGTGTIGLSMASRCANVTGIEIVPGAVECARLNAAANGIENAEFVCADASDTQSVLESLGKQKNRFDVAVLDPPRKGCTPELLGYIAKLGIPKLVYISCAPDTLVRDAAILRDLGYHVMSVDPVDMFPVTGHIETVCLLSKLG